MARINLLPWRSERRKQREREFYMLLVVAALAGCLAVLLAVGWMSRMISGQQARNQYLKGEIAQLDKQLVEIQALDKTKSQLLARKQIIEQLQSNRSQMVHLFDEMVKTIPDGVRLTSMKQSGQSLTLEGVAESNAGVASYMRNIDASPWMGHSDLRKIENQTGAKGADRKMPYAFSLEVTLRKPEEAQTGTAGEAGAKAGEPVASTSAATPAEPGATKPAADATSGAKPAAPAPVPAATGSPAATAPAHAPAAPAAKPAQGAKP